MPKQKRDKIKPSSQIGGGAKQKRKLKDSPYLHYALVFLIITLLFVPLYYLQGGITGFAIFQTLTQSDFDSGTYNWTFYNSSGFVQLNDSRLNGTFTSQIFDAGSSSSWNNISWTSNAIGELPSNQQVETSFGNGNANMTGNVLLLHLNNDSAFGENDTHVYDFSGNGNNGTVINGESDEVTSSGKLNGGFDFDGTDDYVLISNSASLNNWNEQTISVWFRREGAMVQYARLIEKGANNEWTIFFNRDPNDNKISVSDLGGTAVLIKSTNSFAIDEWHHLVVTINSTYYVNMYIDGVLDVGAVDVGVAPSKTGDLNLGRYGGGSYYYNGSMDELAIFNRSLPAQEIQDIYKRGALRLNLSVQSCNDASCSGESFTNLGNNLTSPQNLSVTNNTYFQYKFEFETDNVSYTPELYNVTIDYTLFPTVTLNSPSNNSYFNEENSVLLNATVYDLDLNNMTVWFYGGYANGTYTLINTTYNQTNGTFVTYNWTGLNDLGEYNWTVTTNGGTVNSTNEYFFFNLINLTVNCETGGGYQQGALVLAQGNVTDGTSALNSQNINLTVYDANNNLDASANLTSTNDGSFETTFSGLAVGSYTLYANTTYQGFNKTCTDTFVVGSPADFVLDKIISLYNMTNTTINYNITLRVVNIGGSDATSTTLTDSDSSSSPYDLTTVSANSTVLRSYLKEYTRNSTTYNSTLSIATVNATDSYSGNEISVNSTEIVLTIPESPTGQQLTLIKNAYYNSENSTAVNYSLTVDVVNSGGVDLSSISLIDTDLDINTNINLNRTQNYSSSGSIIIDKAASNTNKLFVKASATVNSVTYQSNQIQVRIPGYGGPADLTVYAPASVSTSTSFDTTIEVENQNPDIGQDFTTDYWITSNDETINYTSGQQTVYVAASGTSNITATLTSPSSAGTYRLRSSTSWAGGTATAFDSFTVTAPSSDTGTGGSSGGDEGSITGRATEEEIEVKEEEGKIKIIDFPDKTEIILEETLEKTFGIENSGKSNLNNVKLAISGLPLDSYTITPEKYDTILPEETKTFTITFKADIKAKKYNLKFIVTSDEGSEEVDSVLVVKEKVELEKPLSIPLIGISLQIWIIIGAAGLFVVILAIILWRQRGLKEQLQAMKKQIMKSRDKNDVEKDITKVKKDLDALETMYTDELIPERSYKGNKEKLNKKLEQLKEEFKNK